MAFYKCSGGNKIDIENVMIDLSKWDVLWTASSNEMSAQVGNGSSNQVYSDTVITLNGDVMDYDFICVQFYDYVDYATGTSDSTAHRCTFPTSAECYANHTVSYNKGSVYKTRRFKISSYESGASSSTWKIYSAEFGYCVIFKIYGLKL